MPASTEELKVLGLTFDVEIVPVVAVAVTEIVEKESDIEEEKRDHWVKDRVNP
jgi:hypothetical protein